jgi:aminoacrylate hydrolase
LVKGHRRSIVERMATLQTQGISLHYELFGDPQKPPVVLLHGLGGSGKSWGSQVERFAQDHFVVLPDQRGTGQSSRPDGGYTIEQLAVDTAELLRHLGIGPAHVIGTSTGGAIAQALALDRAALVRSNTLASSFARADDYAQREFALRRKLVLESDPQTVYSCYALFLFGPRYARDNPDRVQAWVDRVAALPMEREVSTKRIDMILAHDARARLSKVQQPSLVICGELDACVPLPHSEELAQLIPGAELSVVPGGGHFIHTEQPDEFYRRVRSFLDRH